MKRIFLTLAVLILVITGRSQDLGVDMTFTIFPKTVIEQQPELVFWGGADYYREKHLFHSFPDKTLTNYLSFWMRFPAQPASVWMVERQADDSFVPIFQVTNIINDPDYGYLTWQEFKLTTNQIHSLIVSNWYTTVDFGDSNFLINIEPDYLFAKGPIPKVVLPPVPGMHITPYYKVISLNNSNAVVVFDGLPSTDPYYLPIEFTWVGWEGSDGESYTFFTNSEMRFTRTIDVGFHWVVLNVSDEIAVGHSYYFNLEVVTPAQDVNDMISELQNSSIPAEQMRLYNRILSLAAIQFNQGHMNRGRNYLSLFQKTLKHGSMNATGIAYFSSRAQFIMDAFQKPSR